MIVPMAALRPGVWFVFPWGCHRYVVQPDGGFVNTLGQKFTHPDPQLCRVVPVEYQGRRYT